MPNAIIKLENVSWTYSQEEKQTLKKINIEIEEGDFVAVMGSNGSGKSTLCRLFNGLIPHSLEGQLLGTATIDGIITASSTVAVLSQKVGMVFEDSAAQLFTTKVYDEVAFALENVLLPPQEIMERVDWALNIAGLWDYRDSPPSILSGGQKQRLAIAAALAMAEKILVLDDPACQLDPCGVREVLSCIRDLRAKKKLTVVMATHSGEEAAEFANKICVLIDGTVAAFGTPRQIFTDKDLSVHGSVSLPQISEFAHCMEKYGQPLPYFPVNQSEAEKAVFDWYNVKTNET